MEEQEKQEYEEEIKRLQSRIYELIENNENKKAKMKKVITFLCIFGFVIGIPLFDYSQILGFLFSVSIAWLGVYLETNYLRRDI